MKSISEDDLAYLIRLSAPSNVKPQVIVSAASSNPLNNAILSVLKSIYKVDDSGIVSLEKFQYKIDDMIDQEKYAAAGPGTKNIADKWVERLKALYGDSEERPIKKSKDDETGHPGIQSGGRRLLKKVYNTSTNDKLQRIGQAGTHVMVVDDILIGGSSMSEIIGDLLELGVDRNKIVGYVLGSKNSK